MRNGCFFAACLLLLSCAATKRKAPPSGAPDSKHSWTLVFEDDFNSSGLIDSSKWSYCKREGYPWARYLTPGPGYAFTDSSNLVLRMDRQRIAGDAVPYHSGGVETKEKFSFTYGKVEVRAKFIGGRGSWPAIWMMPEKSGYGIWPASGEIDIMEHLNNEKVVHQTIHNAAVTGSKGGSRATRKSRFIAGDYNIYGIVWTVNRIECFVNNRLRFSYVKPPDAGSREWPFDQAFYLILNQSGGDGWPGPITDVDLPFIMYVDWVKVYQENPRKPGHCTVAPLKPDLP